MKRINAYDETGKVITSLTQWDSNRCFYIRNYNFNNIPNCHFETSKLNEALVVKGQLTEDREYLCFNIPNILLCHKEKITAYIYQGDFKDETAESKTIYIVSFDILKRIKPADYVYTATEAFNYSHLSEMVSNLINDVEEGKYNSNGNGTTTYEIPEAFYSTEFFAFDRNHTTDPNTTDMNIYIPSTTIELAELKVHSAKIESDESSGLIESQPEDFDGWSFDNRLEWFERVYKPYFTISQNSWCPNPIKTWLYYALTKSGTVIPLQQFFRNDMKIQITIERENTGEETIIIAYPNLFASDNGVSVNIFHPFVATTEIYEADYQTYKFSLMIIGNCPKYLSDDKYATANDKIKEVAVTFIPNNTFVEAVNNESI